MFFYFKFIILNKKTMRLKLGDIGILLTTGETVELEKISSNLEEFKDLPDYNEFKETEMLDKGSIYVALRTKENPILILSFLEDFQPE